MGEPRTTLCQNRRVISTNSGLASSNVTVRGSKAIPQIGQVPGSDSTISECIGQVYSVREAATDTSAGSNAMPQIGQAPGFDSATSGSIGQMYLTVPFVGTDVGFRTRCSGGIR